MIFNKQDFTVNDLLEETAELDGSVLICNSNLFPEPTLKSLEIEDYGSFEAITSVFDDGTDSIFCHFSWGDDIEASISLEYLRNFAEKSEKIKEMFLSRDVEDGFVFANYENIVYNEKYIVLC